MRIDSSSVTPALLARMALQDHARYSAAELAGNGQIVAAVVGGQMLLKKFMQKNGQPARLESFNPRYQPIPITEEVRIQGIYEGKFDPLHSTATTGI